MERMHHEIHKFGNPMPVGIHPNAKTRENMSKPALKAFFNICEKWRLKTEDQQALLGWIPPSTFYKWKAGNYGKLDYDQLIRISLILGIYKALHILYPQEEFANNWVNMPNTNSLFHGFPPKQLMIEQGIEGMSMLRRLLDGRRGGWN